MKKLKRVPKLIDKEKRLVLKQAGINIQREARNNHRFNNPPHMITSTRQYSPSGNLDRSISYSVKTQKGKNSIALRVYLNPSLITNNGINYGRVQHDGMGSGFRRSPISPAGGTSGRNNLKNDWFLYNAYKKELPSLKKELKRVPSKAIRKAGL
jgi:hypothetical protein